MGEVGVDPQRVAQAASALEALRDALAANVPVIVNTLSGYGFGQGTSALRQAQARSPKDASDMRARARLAALWLAQYVNINAQGQVEIPWDHQAVDMADAKAETQALAAAEANKDPQAALAAIQAIQQDLKDHIAAGDTAWLGAFYNQAAPQVANLASLLHSRDGSGLAILSSQDKQVMGTFAQGLAATAAAGKLSGPALTAFTHAPDIWSSAMLLSLGPGGKAYGTRQGAQLLGGVTASLLDAERAGTLTIPIKGQLGGNTLLDGVSVNKALAQYDPALALLRLDTANGAAASVTLSGPGGKAIAAQLMTMQFMHYSAPDPGYGPQGFTAYPNYTGPEGPWDHYMVLWPPQAAGDFLNAATAAPRGGNSQAQWAAQAAVNIIESTPAPTGSGGVSLPEPVRQALMDTYARYLPDLAKSLADPGTSPLQNVDGTYVIGVTNQGLSKFLQQICASKQDFVTIHGMAGSAIGTSAALKLRGVLPPGLSNPTSAFSQLYGDISQQAAQIGISRAEQADLRNQELNVMISMAQSGFGAIPGGGVLTAAQKLASFISPIPHALPTDNAQLAQQAAAHQLHTEQVMAMVPFVRGLEKAGVQLPQPPPSGSFTASGAPTATFFNWWADTGAGEVVGGHSLGDEPGGWVPSIQQEMGFGAGS